MNLCTLSNERVLRVICLSVCVYHWCKSNWIFSSPFSHLFTRHRTKLNKRNEMNINCTMHSLPPSETLFIDIHDFFSVHINILVYAAYLSVDIFPFASARCCDRIQYYKLQTIFLLSFFAFRTHSQTNFRNLLIVSEKRRRKNHKGNYFRWDF